jgi:hypothetical protein
MDYNQTLARIYDHLEEDHLEKALMGCVRIARNTNDTLQAVVFLRELYPNKHEIARMLRDETSHLNEEARKFLWETSLDRYLEVHTLDISFGKSKNGKERNVLMISVGELENELQQWERVIADMAVPPGMDPFDTAAFTDRFIREKAGIRLRIKALHTIKARLKAHCLNYAVRFERQLLLQRNSQGFLERVQNDVNNFFKARSEDVFLKLQKATQLASSADIEDSSLLLTEVRRALEHLQLNPDRSPRRRSSLRIPAG